VLGADGEINHSNAPGFSAGMRYFRYAAPVVALAAFAFPVALNAAGAPAQHVRGTISAVTPKLVTVTTATGSVSVPLDAKTKVAGVVPATASEITSGTFIGTANVPGPGAARALEVVVFPKALAGTGEGDYPWDLPARGRSSSTMTNGTVASGGSRTSMMTNATVKNVTNGSRQDGHPHVQGRDKNRRNSG